MKTRMALIVGAVLTAGMLIYALAVYPALPDRIPVHWNLHGEVDGWGAKQWAAFFGPAMMALLLGMLVALPWLSPRNFEVEPFRQTFNYVMVMVMVLLGYLHALMLQAGLHPGLEVGRMLVGGLFVFVALLGNVLGKVRRNFWLGIRTPWALASEAVWNATHRLAARLLVAGGLGGALAVWLGAPLALCFWLLMAVLFIPVLHSLLLYKRLEREGQG